TMLMRVSFHSTEVALARMVMPRSFSMSPESMTRSATRWLSRTEPDCFRSASTRVVFPWSTCAMIAMFRSFICPQGGLRHDRARRVFDGGSYRFFRRCERPEPTKNGSTLAGIGNQCLNDMIEYCSHSPRAAQILVHGDPHLIAEFDTV